MQILWPECLIPRGRAHVSRCKRYDHCTYYIVSPTTSTMSLSSLTMGINVTYTRSNGDMWTHMCATSDFVPVLSTGNPQEDRCYVVMVPTCVPLLISSLC